MKDSVTIDGEEYDLANGSLFLISLRTAQIKIGQIEQDIYERTPKTRGQLAEDVPGIKAFFESSETILQKAMSQYRAFPDRRSRA